MEIDSAEFTAGFVKKYIPLKRPGKVNDIAPVYIFVASEESILLPASGHCRWQAVGLAKAGKRFIIKKLISIK